MNNKIILLIIPFSLFLGLYSFTNNQEGLPPETTIPYFLAELCIDNESSKLFESYNGQKDRKEFVAHTVKYSIKKCDPIINDLALLIANKFQEKHSVSTIKKQHHTALKQKIKTIMTDKHAQIIYNDFDEIMSIKGWDNHQKKFDQMIETLEKNNELDSFLQEKIDENDKNFSDMLAFLEKIINNYDNKNDPI